MTACGAGDSPVPWYFLPGGTFVVPPSPASPQLPGGLAKTGTHLPKNTVSGWPGIVTLLLVVRARGRFLVRQTASGTWAGVGRPWMLARETRRDARLEVVSTLERRRDIRVKSLVGPLVVGLAWCCPGNPLLDPSWEQDNHLITSICRRSDEGD